MGRRTREGRPAPAAYARSEAKNAAVRETLVPLAPGEHPTALRIAIGLALVLAVSNVVLWAVGWDVQGQDPGAFGAFLFAGIMLFAAWGMWQHKYIAVLGFEALLGIVVVSAALGLLVASNLTAAALSLTVVALSGWLFWRLIRVMGRLQAPQRPAG